MKKSGLLYDHERVLLFILKNYGHAYFMTDEIYASAALIGLPETSVGSALNRLKAKNILNNGNPRRTNNNRTVMTWWVVDEYSIAEGIRYLTGSN